MSELIACGARAAMAPMIPLGSPHSRPAVVGHAGRDPKADRYPARPSFPTTAADLVFSSFIAGDCPVDSSASTEYILPNLRDALFFVSRYYRGLYRFAFGRHLNQAPR